MVDEKKGTVRVLVEEQAGATKKYLCVFRASRKTYGGSDGKTPTPALDPIESTGVSASGAAIKGAGFPAFDTAELLRKGVIYDVVISYRDGNYTKSQRVIVAKSKLQTFLADANGGKLKYDGKPVTSGSLSQTAVTHL